MRNLISGLLIVFTFNVCIAGEGMWLPLLLQSLNESEMQQMGMKLKAEDIYSVNKGSLKDAIAHFGGFCTSEVISNSGLLLTNHHCGYRQIQSHSSLDNNLIKNGFWAKSFDQELPNPGLFATFIESIEDVSDIMLMGVTDEMTEKERQSTIDKNMAKHKASIKLKEHHDIIIRPFFHGNQYFLFNTITFPDVRLVGTPPESIGKFGADTDNWVWPRHTGDFSLFRIYAGPDNAPAEYSTENKPYKPKHFLPISLDGVAEGDFTMIFGFPGRTNSYLPSQAVAQIQDVLDPAKISIRDKALKIIDAEMRADEAIKIKYASKFASTANYWKKWIGESQGLKSTGAVAKKQKFEAEFNKRVAKNPEWNKKYGSLLDEFEQLYEDIEPYAYTRDHFNEIIGRNVELMRVAGVLNRLASRYNAENQDGFNRYLKRVKSFATGFYKDYEPAVDKKVFAELMAMYFEKVNPAYIPEDVAAMFAKYKGDLSPLADQMYGSSMLTNTSKVLDLLEKDPKQIIDGINADVACSLQSKLNETFQDNVESKYQELNAQIQSLQRTYMKGMMTAFPEKKFYPDANSTMRVTYGQVNGYKPRDAVTYDPVTYLSGVIEKYVPEDYEFDVPEKLQTLYAKKNFGRYADKGKMPVCFLGSNHTTGGNSGSPAIDANGNLIGLNFDRVWEGTMSDINYDKSICRNIMVDARYILFIIDKFAGAGHLVDEMKLVHPKLEKKGQKLTAPLKNG